MQHVLQISRKIDYGLRAMIYLAGLPAGKVASLQDLSSTLHLPREFLAKILKVLAARGLVRSSRGAHGG
ncbi:MAG: RrF2 family transcriptional regulator, partial [Myxococcales bacterium]